MKSDNEKRKDLKRYMEIKYGKAYMSAIAKLNEPNQFDDKGFLKPELKLTSEEEDALMFYVPETTNFFMENPIKSSEENFLVDNDLIKDMDFPDLIKIEDLTISDEFASNIKFPDDLEDRPKSR